MTPGSVVAHACYWAPAIQRSEIIVTDSNLNTYPGDITNDPIALLYSTSHIYIGHLHMVSRCYCECSKMLVPNVRNNTLKKTQQSVLRTRSEAFLSVDLL